MYNKNCLNQQPPTDGYIDILNYGGFFVRFWGDYTLNGVTQEFYVGAFPVGGERRIVISRKAINITVHIEMEPFPFIWTPIQVDHFDKSDEICYVTYGVTVYPLCKQIPCTSPGVIKEVFGQGVFMPMSYENLCNNCTCGNPCNNCICENACKSYPINDKNSSFSSKCRYYSGSI